MERQWTHRNTTIEGPHWKCPSSPKPTPPNQQRDRAGASIGSDHHKPLAHSAKAIPPPSLPASAGPFPRPTTPNQQRERAEASIGSDHQKPLAHSAKAIPPPSLPARAGPFPRPLTPDMSPKIFHVFSESRVPQPQQHHSHDLPAVEQDPPRCPPWQHPSLQNRGLIQPTDRGLRSI